MEHPIAVAAIVTFYVAGATFWIIVVAGMPRRREPWRRRVVRVFLVTLWPLTALAVLAMVLQERRAAAK